MIVIPSYTLGSARLRVIICLFLLIAASMVVVGAIASSRRESARAEVGACRQRKSFHG